MLSIAFPACSFRRSNYLFLGKKLQAISYLCCEYDYTINHHFYSFNRKLNRVVPNFSATSDRNQKSARYFESFFNRKNQVRIGYSNSKTLSCIFVIIGSHRLPIEFVEGSKFENETQNQLTDLFVYVFQNPLMKQWPCSAQLLRTIFRCRAVLQQCFPVQIFSCPTANTCVYVRAQSIE